MEVDVGESLGHQENGRRKPAKKKEYAELKIKQYLCNECSRVVEIDKKSFGEEILCPDCNRPMIQNV